MKRLYTVCLAWSLGLIAAGENTSFDDLMHIGNPALLHAQENMNFYGVTGMKLLEECKKLYQNKIGNLGQQQRTVRIPKKIHQIWLGSPFPEKYKKWQEQIKALHPDWEYKLWTDADIIQFKLRNGRAYNKARNWGEKSDILRYEILHREGGVYLDCDVQCFKKLDELHQAFDFYAGFEPFWAGSETRCLTIGNAIIASAPGHPIMARCIKNIKKFSKLHFAASYKIQTVIKTGPMMFTLSCYEIMAKENLAGRNSIIFPSKLFYPEDAYHRDANANNYFAHYWTHSWLN